jgi:hypothetical protein
MAMTTAMTMAKQHENDTDLKAPIAKPNQTKPPIRHFTNHQPPTTNPK